MVMARPAPLWKACNPDASDYRVYANLSYADASFAAIDSLHLGADVKPA